MVKRNLIHNFWTRVVTPLQRMHRVMLDDSVDLDIHRCTRPGLRHGTPTSSAGHHLYQTDPTVDVLHVDPLDIDSVICHRCDSSGHWRKSTLPWNRSGFDRMGYYYAGTPLEPQGQSSCARRARSAIVLRPRTRRPFFLKSLDEVVHAETQGAIERAIQYPRHARNPPHPPRPPRLCRP